LYQVDDGGFLYISPAIHDSIQEQIDPSAGRAEWQKGVDHRIHLGFYVAGEAYSGLNNIPQGVMYLYYSFLEGDLPDLCALHAIGRLGASLIAKGYRVLSHCSMGENRSALLAGIIMTYLGIAGEQAYDQIRTRREGALYNLHFANYLRSLPPSPLADF